MFGKRLVNEEKRPVQRRGDPPWAGIGGSGRTAETCCLYFLREDRFGDRGSGPAVQKKKNERLRRSH